MSFWLAARSPRFALARAFGFRSISCGNGSTVRALASLCSALRAMGRRIVILSSVSTGICFVQSSWPYQPKQQNQEGSTAQDTPHGVKTPPAAQQLRCFLTARVESWIDQLMIRRQHDNEREWHDGAEKDRSRRQPDIAV